MLFALHQVFGTCKEKDFLFSVCLSTQSLLHQLHWLLGQIQHYGPSHLRPYVIREPTYLRDCLFAYVPYILTRTKLPGDSWPKEHPFSFGQGLFGSGSGMMKTLQIRIRILWDLLQFRKACKTAVLPCLWLR